MHEPIDAVIPLGPHDQETVAASVRSVRRFVQDVRTIYIVSREDPKIDDTTFIPESVFPFDLNTVGTLLGTQDRAGWYLQQLIKLYFASTHPDCLDRVLVVDADTIFLRPCRFVEDHRVVLNFGDEFHQPYFAHMARMHPALQKRSDRSGITHCMLFDRHWVASLMREVEAHHRGAKPFWEIFLAEVDPDYRHISGASEYETYFNYCLLRHSDDVVLKRFQWFNGYSVEDLRPDLHDYVVLHWHTRTEPAETNALLEKLA